MASSRRAIYAPCYNNLAVRLNGDCTGVLRFIEIRRNQSAIAERPVQTAVGIVPSERDVSIKVVVRRLRRASQHKTTDKKNSDNNSHDKKTGKDRDDLT